MLSCGSDISLCRQAIQKWCRRQLLVDSGSGTGWLTLGLHGCSRLPCLSVPAASLLVDALVDTLLADAQPNTSVFPPSLYQPLSLFPCPAIKLKNLPKILLSAKSIKVRMGEGGGGFYLWAQVSKTGREMSFTPNSSELRSLKWNLATEDDEDGEWNNQGNVSLNVKWSVEEEKPNKAKTLCQHVRQ